MSTGILFVVSAPSGAGKTTLVKGLLEALPGLQLSVSYTSRPPRAGEVDGRDYHFVSRETFLGMARQGAFLESAEVYGNLYGTSEAWVRGQMAAGRDIVLEIDCQGAAQVRGLFPDCVGVFIAPPSLAALEERLRGRGQDGPEVLARRLAAAKEELSHAPEFDYVIINASLDLALQDFVGIVRAERLRLARQLSRHGDLFNQFK